MAEMMLIALEGGSTVRNGKDVPCGHMQEGFCVALAATMGLNEALDAIGADGVARMLEENDVKPPPTGGLWVLETQPDPQIQEDEDQECGIRFRWLGWRKPTWEELRGLLGRQALRQARAKDRSVDVASVCDAVAEQQWTFRGARA